MIWKTSLPQCSVCVCAEMDMAEYESIVNYLDPEVKVYPSWIEESEDSKSLKRNFRRKCENFEIQNGKLFHVKVDRNRKKVEGTAREVLQAEKKHQVLTALHARQEGGGHFGVCAT